MSLSDPFNLASSGFLAASLLITNCSALWNSEKVLEAGVLPTRNGGQKGLLCPGATQDHAQLSITVKPEVGRRKDLLLSASIENTRDLSKSNVSWNSKIGEVLS